MNAWPLSSDTLILLRHILSSPHTSSQPSILSPCRSLLYVAKPRRVSWIASADRSTLQVGGSLAGLMNAIVLQDLGHEVHVLEKSSEDALCSQAAGLSAGPDVQRLIKEYLKPAKEYAKIATAVEVVDLEGNVINPIPSKDPYHLTTWSLLYNLFKSHLLAPGSIKPAARYDTGKTVSAVEPEGDALAVSFTESGTQEVHKLRADLVIAADGAHSTTRTSIFPDVTPRYAGFITWRGAVPASQISPASRKAMEGRLLIFRTDEGYTVS